MVAGKNHIGFFAVHRQETIGRMGTGNINPVIFQFFYGGVENINFLLAQAALLPGVGV